VIKIKRVYEPIVAQDGTCYLVDRLWPRGIKKENLAIAAWLKELAPSNELRHWYNHEPEKWPEFCRRYFVELEENPKPLQTLLDAARQGNITLLYSSRELEINNAAALKLYLQNKLGLKD
jgi:uncharacterized protein YeaO (DUF488 family)